MNDHLTIYTIGYTKKTAETFFLLLRNTGAKHLLDIRLKNTSQLAGFTKRDDLKYFLQKLLGMEYHEIPELAPDESTLKKYHQTKNWNEYELSYSELIKRRKPEREINSKLLEDGVELTQSSIKPRITFTDKTRATFSRPAVDLTLWDYCYTRVKENGDDRSELEGELLGRLQNVDRLYLRLGLARPWKAEGGGIEKCWLQVTGIHTFPDYLNGKCFADF
ncbi:MAG: DUF488 domain-containing protein [Dehalococcoidia bacterium]|nr:DUF488 domain-containing protein [Dehalococcoidia bacterium]